MARQATKGSFQARIFFWFLGLHTSHVPICQPYPIRAVGWCRPRGPPFTYHATSTTIAITYLLGAVVVKFFHAATA